MNIKTSLTKLLTNLNGVFSSKTNKEKYLLDLTQIVAEQQKLIGDLEARVEALEKKKPERPTRYR